MVLGMSLENYAERIAVLSKEQKRRLKSTMNDPESLRILRENCERNHPIRVEVDGLFFPMSSLEDIANLREELGLEREVTV